MPINITGTGRALPKLVVNNTDLEKLVDTNDEWIFTRTGIKSRRILSTETLEEMAIEAATKALESAKIEKEEIDLIICATFTSDSGVPSLSAIVRKALNCQKAVAFDINAACTGFIYALTIAESLMKTIGYRKVLIVGAEALSKVLDWTDRETCILFGDGAGAAVLENTEDGGILATQIDGQIDKDNALTCLGNSSFNPFSQVPQTKSTVKMNGKAVFAFAVTEMTRLIKEVTAKADIGADDIAFFVPHQANMRIISSTVTRMGIDKDKFFMNLENIGNTSAASIGIALDELYRSGKLKSGDLIMLIGFGGGFTSGAVLLRV